MKRFVMMLVMVLGITGVAFAGLMRVEQVVNSTGSAPISITNNTSVYTHSFPTKSGEYFGLFYKATSVIGSPNISIELMQSYELPTTEGVADTEWCEADGMADVATGITTETQHGISLSPIPAPYARFRINSLPASATDTTVDLRLIVVEEN